MSAGYIYVATVSETGEYKIGTSKSPREREVALCRKFKTEIKIIWQHWVQDAYAVEQKVLNYLSDYNTRGEFFLFDAAILEKAKMLVSDLASYRKERLTVPIVITLNSKTKEHIKREAIKQRRSINKQCCYMLEQHAKSISAPASTPAGSNRG